MPKRADKELGARTRVSIEQQSGDSDDDRTPLEASARLTLNGKKLAVRVTFQPATEGNGWGQLTLSPEAPLGNHEGVGGELSAEQPPPPRGVAVAASWIADLDTGAKTDLLHGRAVTKRIPQANRPPLPTPTPRAEAAEYTALRPSLGELVRPLVLGEPDTSALLPYQLRGVVWLRERDAAILADDMGLGKTLQALTAVRQLAHDGTCRCALVVAPRTILATWEEELSRWAPELSRLRVTPAAHQRADVWRTLVGRVHVLITNYEQLREPPPTLTERGVDVVIADEAHRIRNLKAAITSGMRALRFRRFWALTGTPIERDAEDLATLLSILAPDRFSPEDARLAAATLRARARPYMLRRRKADVLPELPAVIDGKEILELAPAQRRAYDAAKRKARTARGDRGHVLQLVNELRMICDYAPDGRTSAKLERITEHLLDVRDRGEKAVVFSTFLEPLRILRADLEKGKPPLKTETITGEMPVQDREAALRRFSKDADVVALLASMRATSEGLTLTAANHVFFVNEWWNPSANAQARDRVVRIGQERGVRVYRFMCRDTVEEALDRILARKSELFQDVVEQLAEPGAPADPRARELLEEIVGSELSES